MQKNSLNIFINYHEKLIFTCHAIMISSLIDYNNSYLSDGSLM